MTHCFRMNLMTFCIEMDFFNKMPSGYAIWETKLVYIFFFILQAHLADFKRKKKFRYKWSRRYEWTNGRKCTIAIWTIIISSFWKQFVLKMVNQKVIKTFTHYLHATCAVQNLYWKLGQQKPSAGTLLAYLDATD